MCRECVYVVNKQTGNSSNDFHDFFCLLKLSKQIYALGVFCCCWCVVSHFRKMCVLRCFVQLVILETNYLTVSCKIPIKSFIFRQINGQVWCIWFPYHVHVHRPSTHTHSIMSNYKTFRILHFSLRFLLFGCIIWFLEFSLFPARLSCSFASISLHVHCMWKVFTHMCNVYTTAYSHIWLAIE